MKIRKLTYKDKISGWNIQNLELGRLTLLVGASGVGKTQILRAVMSLRNIAIGRSANGIEWYVEFDIDHHSYQWQGEFSPDLAEYAKMLHRDNVPIPMVYEKIYKDGELIVERNAGEFLFKKERTVKLEMTKSAVSLLKEENEILPIYDGFRNISQLNNTMTGVSFSAGTVFEKSKVETFDEIRSMRFLRPIDRLFMLYRSRRHEFEEVKNDFIRIFPVVEDVKFTVETAFDDVSSPVLQIKEHGVDEWILYQNISSGMIRTLAQIVTLRFAEDGDILLIDEFENSLGVNCIDQVAEMVLDCDRDIQFIITSHHPYIINAISFDKWKIVTRHGSDVTVHSAEDLHIGAHSRHEKFMQLIQTTAYRTGQL